MQAFAFGTILGAADWPVVNIKPSALKIIVTEWRLWWVVCVLRVFVCVPAYSLATLANWRNACRSASMALVLLILYSMAFSHLF